MKVKLVRNPHTGYDEIIKNVFTEILEKTGLEEPLKWQWSFLYLVFSDYLYYLDNKQTKFLDKDCLGGGAGVGKTHIMCYALICEMMFFGNIFKTNGRQYKALYASGSYEQLQASVVNSIDILLSNTKLNRYFDLTRRELIYTPYRHCTCNFRVCNNSNPLSLKGSHPNGIMRVILDEMNAMPEAALDITTSYFGSPDTSRRESGTGGRITIASNPDQPGSKFHQIIDGMLEGWNTFNISREDVCTDFSKDILANSIRDTYGEDSPMYKNYVLGEHTLSNSMSTYPEHILMASIERNPNAMDNYYYIGVDIAGGVEQDYSAYAVRNGDVICELFRINTEDIDSFCDRIFQKILQYRPVYCANDEVGVGQGFTSMLKHKINAWNTRNIKDQIICKIEGIRNNEKSSDNRYANRATQLAWRLRYWLQYQGHLPNYIPFAKELINDLRIITCYPTAQGFYKLTEKSKLSFSPDLAEALFYSFGSTNIIEAHAVRPEFVQVRRYNYKRPVLC